MAWLEERFKKFYKVPLSIHWLHTIAYFVVGVGVGVLLENYLKPFGWWIILLGVVLLIPGAYKYWIEK